MSQVIDVYHCSPDKIDTFIFDPESGVHFGGIFSALEAGVRKYYNTCNTEEVDTIFIHKCKLLTIKDNILYTNDKGGGDEWYELISDPNNLSPVYQYENQYEPDVVPSWLVVDPLYIEHYDTLEIKVHEAEKILGDFQDGNIHSITL